MKIVADAHIPFLKEYFSPYGELILKPGRLLSAKDVHDADILLVRSITHVDEHLLADSRVKFVGSVTAGADHLDTNWLSHAGIAFSIAAGFNAPPVADYVISVIAALQLKRMLPREKVKAAVIGVGNVGQLIEARLKLLNFDVILCDPLRAQHENNFPSVTLDELADVDLISLHVPLTRNNDYPTYHFIDQHFLARQKPGTVLLNASRGAVINSKDLMEYGNHLLWCFDVWDGEPRINKLILEQAAIATPHIAGYSVQSKIRGIDQIYRSACQKKILNAELVSPLTIPSQTLAFAPGEHRWQEIVLGVFNPLILTAMMRTMLLPAEDHGALFDEMRNQFNYRHEFAYTNIASLETPDKELLTQLGLKLD